MDFEHIMAEIRALKSLLADTDEIGSKLIEGLVEHMASATPENFIAQFLAWLSATLAQNGEVIRNRAAWRASIDELETLLPADE